MRDGSPALIQLVGQVYVVVEVVEQTRLARGAGGRLEGLARADGSLRLVEDGVESSIVLVMLPRMVDQALDNAGKMVLAAEQFASAGQCGSARAARVLVFVLGVVVFARLVPTGVLVLLLIT